MADYCRRPVADRRGCFLGLVAGIANTGALQRSNALYWI